MADMTRGGKASNDKPKRDPGPSQNDLDLKAIKAAQKYQAQLLGSYLPTQRQTVAQDAQLLDSTARTLGGTATALDNRDRNSQLRWLQQYGAAFDEAGRAADPETQALLRSLGASYTGAPSALDARLNQEAVDAGPSELSRLLDQQAQQQLRLGGSLSPEETRQADQSARGAWADRGLAFSNPALLGEVLNRQSVSDARLAGRQAFATGVNGQLLGEQQANRGFQLGVGAYQEGQKQTGLGLAQLRSSTSPTMQLLNRGTNTGMLLGAGNQVLGSGTAGAANLTGLQDQYAGFLLNRRASEETAAINREEARRALKIQTKSADRAATMALWGSVIEGVGSAVSPCWVAREVYGEESPHWREFREWLLTFAGSRLQRRYLRKGPAIAAWVRAHPAWKPKLRKWMDRCRAELREAYQIAA